MATLPKRYFIALLAAILLALLIYGLYFETADEPFLPGSLAEREMIWGGHSRKFTVYTPSTPAADPSLVFVFHGSGGDAQQSRMMFGYAFEEIAEERGFYVIYPEGYEQHFNGCRKRGPYAANELQIDDVGFLRSLVAHFAGEFGVDRDAVFATGVSNGGQMALRLALEAPGLVAAVAPIATSMPTQENMDCKASGQPVPLLLMNGTDDPMNPYEGGTVALYGLFGDRGTVVSSVDAITYWARLAGHQGPPQRTRLDDRAPQDNSTVVIDSWGDSEGMPVALYSIMGGGHNAPHPHIRLPRILGGTNNDIVAADEIMAFFDKALDYQSNYQSNNQSNTK